ncbi:MAG: AMP-binding protein [Candidatus Lokiarchaeota archaeon]|jgi:long-chain acyl-CoA synthetase|nr:AMP-binding protein [Candidatus Lokiarchaeota archaeon]
MSSPYESRFWRKNWDPGLKDIDPKEFDTTYPDYMREMFDKYPNVMALSYQGLEMTFSDVDKRSNQFANMLIENGFKKGDAVGINLPNIPEYIYSVVGTLKAGCIVSGVSPLMSEVQMQYQLSDLGKGGKQVALVTLDAIFEHRLKKIAETLPQLKVVIWTSAIGSFDKESQAKIKAVQDVPSGEVTPLEGKVVYNYQDDVLVNFADKLPKVDISPDDIGWIQYTGGTTGPPKGAMLTHRNVMSNLLSLRAWLQWEEGKGMMLSGFPMFHVAGLTVCEGALSLGWGQILIANPRDALGICNSIKQFQPTVLVNVPSLYQILINFKKFRRLDHSKLRMCISAASPFPKESQIKLEEIVGEGKLLELYGMTELSPVATMNPSIGKKQLGKVGMPIQNVDLKLVDPDTGEIVPLGEPGEICVKGPNVMLGYYQKPEETAKAIDKDGYMHSGDVGIMDEDGYLRIVDRTKDMIIVGGFKVFSAKVEDTLSKHPAIGMVALVGIPNPDRPGSEIVKAFIQMDPEFEFDGNKEALEEGIISFAKENCAPYEVPKLIEISDELPLTVVGKVDKKILRKN